MARSYITDMQMTREYWFWAVRYAVQVLNYLPHKVNDVLTSPLKLAYGVKPDYQTLSRLFSTVYFKHESDDNRDPDGVKSKLMQGILLGRSLKTNGFIIYSPHTKHSMVQFISPLTKGEPQQIYLV